MDPRRPMFFSSLTFAPYGSLHGEPKSPPGEGDAYVYDHEEWIRTTSYVSTAWLNLTVTFISARLRKCTCS